MKARAVLQFRWFSMMSRCYTKDHPRYKNYGERGIDVAERWHDFECFYNDIKDLYKPGLDMDRIDNDSGYHPGNIRFVSRGVNLRNRGCSLVHKDLQQDQCIKDIAESHNINPKTLYARLNLGWSLEEAINTPIKERADTGRTREPYTSRLTYQEYDQILSMYESNMDIDHIALKVCRDRTIIRRLVNGRSYRQYANRRKQEQ